MNKFIYSWRAILVTFFAIIISACGSLPGRDNADISEPASHYLQLAESSQPPQTQAYLLTAVRRLLEDRMLSQAQTLLYQINMAGTPIDMRQQKTLLQARLYLLKGKSKSAFRLLNSLARQPDMMPNNQQDYHELLAEAYLAQNNIEKSIQQRIILSSFLTNAPKAQQTNQQLIWTNLQHLDTTTLTQLYQKNNEPVLKGWVTLAYISQTSQDNIDQLITRLKAWRSEYPNHPGNSILPASLNTDAAVIANQPKKVALLVPLTGNLKASGQAIRNGFLTAYFYNKKNSAKTPPVTVIDSNKGDIKQIYQQAIDNGADVIVGPLSKSNLNALTADTSSLPVPTIALNTLADYQSQSIKNLYQFGLSSQDVATASADQIWDQGHDRALIIAPNNDWGQSTANTFITEWQKLGGQVIDQLNYNNKLNMSTQVSNLLRTRQSQQRADSLGKTINTSFRFIPRRRQDIDVIFLIATPQQSQQIQPLLRFYFAGNLPIYATSSVFDGSNNSGYNRDLNGIIFPSMPWLLLQPNQLPNNLQVIQQQINQVWPNSAQRHNKLYALGIDAYQLTNRLNQLLIFPQYSLYGATGTLTLDQYNHVNRKLLWAQMQTTGPNLLPPK